MNLKTSRLHERSKHHGRYDFKELCKALPELKTFVTTTPDGSETIDFADPQAVKSLNKSILFKYYDVKYWDIPEGYLCPAVPGRADYIHHAADVLAMHNREVVPMGRTVKVLDIGTGANAVYPIVGMKEYGWYFVGTDIDKTAIDSANNIRKNNPGMDEFFECRLQKNPDKMISGIIQADEEFDLVISNPPFYSSMEEAASVAGRKWLNLGHELTGKDRNFGGHINELVYEGGEKEFIKRLITESVGFKKQFYWFTSLVSNDYHTQPLLQWLKKMEAFEAHSFPMSQGQKNSRIIAWTFLNKREQQIWRERKFWDI